jgi:predicted DNA-binding transcriptional regulator AlpA
MSDKRSRKHLHPKPTSGFMSFRQVSEEFGISLSFLYHLPETILPRYPVGSKFVFDRAEVIEAIKSHRLISPKRKRAVRRRGRPRKQAVAELGSADT